MFSYSDGCNNSYNLYYDDENNIYLEYDPVKPIESSSGEYDGGDYIKEKIARDQYERITALANKIAENKDIQIKNRVMTSGLLIVNIKGVEKRIIIEPSSNEKIEFENELKKLLGD